MINDKERRLLTVEGFIREVEDKLPKTQSFKQAWEKTEEEYKELMGFYRYSSYDHFKTVKSRKKKKTRNRMI